jgi:hypothetical protein
MQLKNFEKYFGDPMYPTVFLSRFRFHEYYKTFSTLNLIQVLICKRLLEHQIRINAFLVVLPGS